jgi:hypothetical protein
MIYKAEEAAKAESIINGEVLAPSFAVIAAVGNLKEATCQRRELN